jgi:hypothetical protein
MNYSNMMWENWQKISEVHILFTTGVQETKQTGNWNLSALEWNSVHKVDFIVYTFIQAVNFLNWYLC